MALANGTIPTSQLVVLSVLSKTLGPQYAPLAVARAFEAANRAFKAQFGKELEPVEAYRWLARQWHLWNGWIKRLPGFNLAAYPGTSKHGSSGAIDFGSRVNVIGSREHLWMVENGPRWGFIWTGKNFSPREPWHFDHNGLIVAGLNVTPVSIPVTPKRKRPAMSVGLVKRIGTPENKAIYAIDLKTSAPLRQIGWAAYMGARGAGAELAEITVLPGNPVHPFDELVRERGVVMMDKFLRPLKFADKPNPGPGYDLIDWNGEAVSRPQG